MNELSQRGLELFLGAVGKPLVLAAVAAVFLRLLPCRNSNVHHRVWLAVLLGMLLLPLLTLVIPPVPLPGSLAILPTVSQWSAWSSSADLGGERSSIDETADAKPLSPTSLGQIDSTASGAASAPLEWAQRRDHLSNEEPHPAASSTVATDSPSEHPVEMGRTQPARGGSITLPILVFAVYLTGFIWMSLRLAVGIATARGLARRSVRVSRPLSCRTRVVVSDEIRVPVSVGILSPCILLPSDWHRWDGELLDSVLSHEQAHIDRRDHMVLWAAEMNRCLYWFHPLAWFLRRRLASLAEKCCDDAVIAQHGDRRGYARHLLEITRRLSESPQRVARLGISMARTTRVESRIESILDAERPLARRLGWVGRLTILAAAAPVVFLAAALRSEDKLTQVTEKPAEKVVSTPDAPAEKATAAAPTGSALRGRVVMENNGAPVPKAAVRLWTCDESGCRLEKRTATTDAQGEFVLENVAKGKHRVLAFFDDLVSRQERYRGLEVTVPQAADQPIVLKLAPAASIKVHVTSKANGEPVSDAAVSLVWTDTDRDHTTDRHGVVTLHGLTAEVWHVKVQARGFAQQVHALNLSSNRSSDLRVTLEPGGSIRGVVRDDAGKPVPEVGISVFPADDGEQIEYMKTDKEGQYAFDCMPLDRPLKLMVWDRRYQHAVQIVALSSAGRRDASLDLTLHKRPDGGSVRGIVADTAGKPIVGASVSNRGGSTSEVRETRTDAEGRFTLDNVFEGAIGHELIVKAGGFAPRRVTFQPGTREAPAQVTVKLAPGHRIGGRVVNAAGQPVSGASVYYAHGNSGDGFGFGGTGNTDKDGRFQFDSLPDKTPFAFAAKGYSEISEKFLPLDGDGEVVVMMQPEGVIRGKVIDGATGAPITSFSVRITFSPDRRPGEPGAGLSGPRAFKGERFVTTDGQFRLDRLTVGMSLQVTVEADGYSQKTERRIEVSAEAEAGVIDFKLAPVDPTSLTTVSGTILDLQSQPIAGAELRLIVAGKRPIPRDRFPFNWEMVRNGHLGRVDGVSQFLSTTSDEKGNFHFDQVGTGKDMELAYWGEGVAEGRQEHLERLSEEQRKKLRVVVTAPGIVRGKINRTTLAEVSMIAVSGRNRIYQDSLASTAASYEIRNVPPGHYHLQVYGKRIPTDLGGGSFTHRVIQVQEIDVIAGQTLSIDLGFDEKQATGAASQDGKPIDGREVKRAAEPAKSKVVSDDGEKNETSRKVISPPGPSSPKRDEAVAENAERRLSGRVVDPEGRPISEALVSTNLRMSLSPGDNWHASAKSDPKGNFVLTFPEKWLAKGAFTPLRTIWAYAPGHQLGTQSAHKALLKDGPQDIEIKLGPATDTAFRVEDPQGKPVPDAVVEPLHILTKAAYEIPPDDIRAAARGVTDAAGRARLPAVAREGFRTVKVVSPPFGEQHLRLEDRTRADSERVIQLRSARRLEVRVTAARPEHARQLPVVVTSPISETDHHIAYTEGFARGVTDDEGRLIVPAIAIGTANIMTFVDPALPVRPQLPTGVDLSDEGTGRIEIPLVPAVLVRGLVRDKSSGKPVDGALISIGYGGARQSDHARSDAEGKFETFVLPGPVRQQAIILPDRYQQLGEPWRDKLVVPVTDKPFDLPPLDVVQTLELNGRLIDQNDKPLVGLRLNGVVGNRRYGFATTAKEGRFTMQVPPDIELSYQVWVDRNIGPVDAEIVERDPIVLRAQVVKPAPEPTR